MEPITRFHDADPSTIRFFTAADGSAGSQGFNLNVFAGAMMFVTATSTNGAITLTFRAKLSSSDSASFIVADSANAAITRTVSPNQAYALPDELFAARYITATTSTGTVDCRIFGKA